MILALTDATIQDVLLGIIGNGLWSLIAQSGTKAVREIRTLVSPPQSSVVKAIREASEHLAPSVPISVETHRRSYLLSRARLGTTSASEWNHKLYSDFG